MGRSILTLLLCALVIAGAGCGSSAGNRGRKGNSNSDANSDTATITINVGKSESRDVASVIEGTGSLVATESSDVASKSAGKVVDVGVNVGQFVTTGALIARLDDKDAKLQLSTARAAVNKAQAAVLQAQAKLGLDRSGKGFNSSAVPEVRQANANYEQALAEQRQAEVNEKRYRDLAETGDVAMITYDQYKTARDTARAKTNAAKEALDATVNTARQNNQAIASARADVVSAQTQVADAQQAIADTVIRAPFAGYVSARPIAVGEFVSSSSVLATILRTNPIKAQIQIPEANVPLVQVGAGVSLSFDAYRDRKFGGSVIAVNPAIDPTNRAAIVEASIENGDNALRSGMFATAQITRAGGEKGIFVPKAAVNTDEATGNYRVFVIQDGVAHLKVVQRGPEEGDFIQILSGVDADQVVAVSSLDQLFEGAKVAY